MVEENNRRDTLSYGIIPNKLYMNYLKNNFYGDHAAVNDIHENNNPNIH